MAVVSIPNFVDEYSKALREGSAAVFAGAGLSVAAGFVDWKGLLKPLADELSLSLDREHDLVRVAQYHINHHSNRHDLAALILDRFTSTQAQVTPSHRILARLPINTYWTTNYDRTIENSLEQAGKVADVKHEQSQLPHTLAGRDAVVYKMHGDYRNATTAVLAKEDYEKYHLVRGDFLTALSSDLLSKTFLFIGFSFSDPNLDYVLSRMYAKHDTNQRKHYCLIAQEHQRPNESNEDFAYRRAKQEFFVRDLQRYNVRVVMLENYDQVPEVLSAIEWRFKSRTVFVSGAAHEYAPLTESSALGIVHKIGDELIGKDYRLVTGLGLGVGSTLLDGALQHIYRVQRRILRDQIVIRPFPQSVGGKQLWTVYRNDMLDFAGIAIFMFGNKLGPDGKAIVPSNGMQEEFDIAVEKKIKVLPLGFTGYMARTLYDKVQSDFDKFYPNATAAFRQHFVDLGNENRTHDEQRTTLFSALVELETM
ncbi:MAG TPA: SIR2 family protein [Candidatus Sulfotelmatobacter sp.]|nr:SIR2 family protein [Candidatus Sulfotelmatobacter sp.]